MALPKKYIKLGGGITKKAYRLWKAAKAKTKRNKPGAKKKAVKKKAAKKPAMKKTATKKKSYKAPTKKPQSRGKSMTKAILSKQTKAVMFDGGTLTLTALATTFAVNKTPYISGLNVWVRGIGQMVLGGLIAYFFKGKTSKVIGLGTAIGGAFTLAMPKFGSVFSMGRRLSNDEQQALTTMGKYMNKNDMSGYITPNQSAMGKPIGSKRVTVGKGKRGSRTRSSQF